jgi:N-formylglutamate amidohydrolase
MLSHEFTNEAKLRIHNYMILHIPHASKEIPFHDGYQLPLQRLQDEILLLTDHYTNELFQREDSVIIQSPCSRIFCDMERFEEDVHEPMSRFGMGVLYTHTDSGVYMREVNEVLRERILEVYYRPHHRRFASAVDAELRATGKALIIDCHSYPDKPFQRDVEKRLPRPDFNLGTDSFHTSKEFIDSATAFFAKRGYSLGLDWPYAGSIVPMAHYRKDQRVQSIMLEVNRRLYMDERSGNKLPQFDSIREVVQEFLRAIEN